MLTTLIGFLSDFGDENFLWPFMAVMAALLIWQGRYRMLLSWIVLIALTFGVIVAAKLWFEACGPLHTNGLYSPSGHTSGATFVYGSTYVLFGRKTWAGFPVALLIAGLIGATRVFLHAHTPPEVLVGATIGLTGVILLILLRKREAPWKKRRIGVALIVGFLGMTVLLHGIRSPAEHWVELMSHRFVSKLVSCPATHDLR